MAIIVREDYLKKLQRCIGKDRIVVLTGQRRVGKSFMLKQLIEVYSDDPANNIIYIDKENKDFDSIRTYHDLNEYITSHFVEGKRNFILIDEAQEIEEFEKSVRSWRTEENTDVIITGSNAKMFSRQLSTLIGGRYTEIEIRPLDYREFLIFHQLGDSDESLAKYIQFGGMPGLVKIGLELPDSFQYLNDVINTALLKDIVICNKIRNAEFMERLTSFVADNTGKPIAAANIARFMKSRGSAVSTDLIIAYLGYLCDAYITDAVKRFNIHGRKLLETNEKYYFEDHGIRNALIGWSREGDIEKILENIVYNELRRRGYNVTVGSLQAGEIDFVAEQTAGGRVYIQVSYLIADETTRKREFGNLLSIKDSYPKYVISMTPLVTRQDNNGITHISLREFLIHGL